MSIIDDWVEKAYSKGRTSTVFFCVSVLHAEKMCMLLRRSGITSAFITAETPKNERNAILKQFEQGKINALCNVAVLTEGWDAPRTDCIAILRPTKSLGLYVQICGRGMRPWPGKEDCLLLDYGENMNRHGCIDKARPSRLPPPEGSLIWVCDECLHVNDHEDNNCEACDAPKPVKAISLDEKNKDIAVSASDIAAEGYVLSDEMPEKNEPIYRSEDVIAVRAKRKTSKNGNDYLSVEFQCDGVYWPQSTALMIGMKGKAGDMARIKWNKMTGSNKYPYTIDLAVTLINEVGVFDKIKQVNLKKEGKYWNVIGVNF